MGVRVRRITPCLRRMHYGTGDPSEGVPSFAARCQGSPNVRAAGQPPGTARTTRASTAIAPAGAAIDRVEVHLEERGVLARGGSRGRRRAARRRRGRRPGRPRTPRRIAAPRRDSRRRRTAASGAGARSTATSSSTSARIPPRPDEHHGTDHRVAPPADDQLDARRRHRLHEQPAQRDAGPAAAAPPAPPTASRIPASSVEAEGHAARLRLVGEAVDVELERDRDAAEVAPRRHDGVRRPPAPRPTASPAIPAAASRLEAPPARRGPRGPSGAAAASAASGSGVSSAPHVTWAAASAGQPARRGPVREPLAPDASPSPASRAIAAKASTAPRSIGMPPAAWSEALTCSLDVARGQRDVHRAGSRAGRPSRRSAPRSPLARPGPRSAGRGTASRGRSPARRTRPHAAIASNATRYARDSSSAPHGSSGLPR